MRLTLYCIILLQLYFSTNAEVERRNLIGFHFLDMIQQGLFEKKKKDALQNATIVVMPPQNSPATFVYSNPGYECPTNFSLDQNGECTRLVGVSSSPGCPLGYESVEGRCQMRVREDVIRSCPYGFYPKGSQCVQFETLEKRLQCPENYTIGEKGCERPVSGRGIPVCNSQDTDKKKISNVQLIGSVCHYVIRVKKEYVCDDKFTLHKDESCAYISTPSYTCPKDYDYVENLNSCVLKNQEIESCKTEECQKKPKNNSDERKSPTPNCPPNYTFDTGVCVSTERRIARGICLAGNDVGDECEVLEIDRPHVQCPGTMISTPGSSDFMCSGFMLTDLIYACPDGAYESNSQCIRETVRNQISICPNGFELSDHGLACEKYVYAEDGLVCPSGTVMSDSQTSCLRVEKSDIIPICPKGGNWSFDFIKQRCKCFGDCSAINNADNTPMPVSPSNQPSSSSDIIFQQTNPNGAVRIAAIPNEEGREIFDSLEVVDESVHLNLSSSLRGADGGLEIHDGEIFDTSQDNETEQSSEIVNPDEHYSAARFLNRRNGGAIESDDDTSNNEEELNEDFSGDIHNNRFLTTPDIRSETNENNEPGYDFESESEAELEIEEIFDEEVEDASVSIAAAKLGGAALLDAPAVIAANNADIVTVALPSIAPRVVYTPQYVVHGLAQVPKPSAVARQPTVCKKKKGCKATPTTQTVRTVRIITPVSPPSPEYYPSGRETTVIAAPLYGY